MQLVFEGGGDAEVAAAAPDGPEQIGFFLFACAHHLAFGRDQFDRAQIVEGKTVPAHQPSKPTAQGEPGDAGARHDAAGNGEVVELRLAIELTPGDPALRASATRHRIDVDALHGSEVDE